MSEKLTNSQAVIALLKATPDVAMKPRQIAHELKVLYPQKYGNHAEGALAGQITAQATSWLVKHPELHRSDDPVQFWWGEPQVETESQIGETHENVPAEKELYPLLAKFLIGRQRKIYAKRIDEKKSKNANGKHGNHWLYPDMVGMEDLTSGWDFAIKNWTAQAGAPQARTVVLRGQTRDYPGYGSPLLLPDCLQFHVGQLRLPGRCQDPSRSLARATSSQ